MMCNWAPYRAPSSLSQPAGTVHTWRRRRRGVTVVELLVVIVILSIVLAIVIPALAGARRQARTVTNTSMLRQAHAALVMYAGDYRDHFPYLATPGEPEAPIRIGQVVVRDGYFGAQMKYWTALIAPAYLDAAPKTLALSERRQQPAIGSQGEGLYTSRYWLTHAAVARPAWWDDASGAPPPELADLRGMRLTDVAYPSEKGLLLDVKAGVFDGAPDAPDGNAYIGIADGAARGENWEQLIEAGRYVDQRPYGAIAWPVLSTRFGLAGKDF